MDLIKDSLGAVNENDIVLITVIRNERDILPAFLQHYASLGVDKFIIIDNDSDDGSQDCLSGLDSLALYHTQQSYRDSIAGINWVNRIADERCMNRWVLVVDADEFMILPAGIDTVQQLRSSMERRLDMGLYCPMVDFFSEDLTAAGNQAYATFDELVAAAPLFMPFEESHLVEIGQYPYVEYRTKGGSRAALTDSKKASPRLGKIPFVFWHQGYRYVKSTHVGTPLPLGFLNGALAHFKFRPGFQERMAREHTNRDRLDPNALSNFLSNAPGQWPPAILKNAHRYSSTDDLVAAGFMSSSTPAPASLPAKFRQLNRTKSDFFNQLAVGQAGQSAHDIIAAQQFEALLKDPTTRFTRRFRSWLYRRRLLRAHYVPELIEQPAARIESMAIFYDSYWWDIGMPFRLFGHIRKAIIWKNLFSRSP
ncbi:MAG: glycosyltransferase family 2 protein [Hyphomicrobiales bacterium]|nr:glycosyltransferase family 2 protein [Hyphomicrobiales bacterium]